VQFKTDADYLALLAVDDSERWSTMPATGVRLNVFPLARLKWQR